MRQSILSVSASVCLAAVAARADCRAEWGAVGAAFDEIDMGEWTKAEPSHPDRQWNEAKTLYEKAAVAFKYPETLDAGDARRLLAADTALSCVTRTMSDPKSPRTQAAFDRFKADFDDATRDALRAEAEARL